MTYFTNVFKLECFSFNDCVSLHRSCKGTSFKLINQMIGAEFTFFFKIDLKTFLQLRKKRRRPPPHLHLSE